MGSIPGEAGHQAKEVFKSCLSVRCFRSSFCYCHPAWSQGMLLPLQHFGLSKDIKLKLLESVQFSSVQLLSRVQLFATP